MEHLTAAARQHVFEILDQGRDMTLATIRPDGFPQATTISYIHDDLTVYAAIGLGSQKAENIQLNNKVSATVNLPYEDWGHIRGLSLAGFADFVRGEKQIERVGQKFLRRFPEISKFAPGSGNLPFQSILFLQVRPVVISLLDYRLGFGHTELYEI